MQSIFLVTLPKSGTVFLYSLFEASLGRPHLRPMVGYFPHSTLSPDTMRKFATGRIVASSHSDPSPENLRVFDDLGMRWVVHVRDPRAAILSWVHHVERPDIREKHAERHGLSEEYFASSLTDKIEFHINHRFREMLWWLDAWKQVIDSPQYRDRILLTRYEDMHGNDEAFARKLLGWFGFNPDIPLKLPPKTLMKSHFRSGRIAEWREAFSPDQVARATAMIDPAIYQRFGWTP